MTKLPLMKNCRVDYKGTNFGRFSVLVDFTTDQQLYYVAGIKQIKELYGEFKFYVKGELPIDNYPLPFINVAKLDGVRYQY